MRVVNFSSATLIVLFALEAFTPLPFAGERNVLQLIGERYRFARVPSLAAPPEELEENGLLFQTGEFKATRGGATIQKLAIHRDGVVIVAPITEVAEEFFEDLYNWLTTELAFRPLPFSKVYLSEMVVDFEQPVSGALKNFKAVAGLISQHLVEANRPGLAVSFNGFSLELASAEKTAPKFIVERRSGSGQAEERYFCSAPLRTNQHVAVLEGLERLLK